MALKLPPRYANVEMGALLGEISDGAFREYARLRAVAWGKEVVEFWFSEYAALFGISEATLYRRLSELRKNAGLCFSSTRNSITGDRLFRVSFSILRTENALIASASTGELQDSQNDKDVEAAILNSENGEWPFKTAEPPVKPAPIRLDQIYERILREITGWMSVPGGASSWRDIGPVVAAYHAAAGQDEAQTAANLQPFWEAWLDRKYSRTGTAWITDWAASGVIPEQRKAKAKSNGNGNYAAVDAALEEWVQQV